MSHYLATQPGQCLLLLLLLLTLLHSEAFARPSGHRLAPSSPKYRPSGHRLAASASSSSSIYVSEDDPGALLYEAARVGNLAEVTRLCDEHAKRSNAIDVIDWHHPEQASNTPTIVATRNDQAGCLAVLLAAGADPNTPDAMAETPAHLACKLGHSASLKVLLATGRVELDARTRIGATPCYWAAFRGHSHCLALMVEAGADVQIPNSFNVPPLSMAQREGHAACVEIITAAINR